MIVDLRCRSTPLHNIFDAGDLVPCGGWETLHEELLDFGTALPAGSTVIAVGGDHSITLPLVSARNAGGDRQIKLVVFDHHLDFQYWSKDRDPPFNTNVMSHVSDMLGPGQVVHIGVDPIQTVDAHLHEWYLEYLAEAGIQIALFSREIDDDDLIADAIGIGQDIYLSIDVDVLCQAEMGSTGYPSDSGLTVSRTIDLIRLIAAQNRIVGCDLVEFGAPANDRRQHTLADAGRASSLLLELILAATSSTVAKPMPEQAWARPSGRGI